MIITSGAWGLLWYGESGGASLRNRVVWVACAAFTTAAMVLLGMEKED
jgi:hypothetical protein